MCETLSKKVIRGMVWLMQLGNAVAKAKLLGGGR